MKVKMRAFLMILLSFSLVFSAAFAKIKHQQRHRKDMKKEKKLKIVASFSDYASIAKEIAGDKAVVDYIASGEDDPHFVPPKPSYAMKLRDADMWITTGMDLEAWSTTLLDKARNKKIMDGEIGFVAVSDGCNIIDIPAHVDRTEGDIHTMGNPHINTSPVNWRVIARNICIGLQKIDPENADYYIANRDKFIDRVDRALFGDELVDMFGGETLVKLLENGSLFTFLQKDYKGSKLIDHLGGWLKKALPFRGKKIIAYHKNWGYFCKTFGLEIAGYIEPKPGIPPSAKHVQKVIKLIKDQHISLMLVASYFEKKTARMIESKTGIKALFIPMFVNGIPEVSDNFKLVDYWIDQINANIK